MRSRLLVLIIASIAAFSCGSPQNQAGSNGKPADPNKKVKIGFSMATVKEERWQRDRDAFEAHCKQVNVDCVITVADNSTDRQANDVDNLLTQGVDVLVIAPQNATQAASLVDKAKAQNIPVISYDRLIDSDKIDLYISHQVPVIGRKIAEYALEHVPKGNYAMVYGSNTDNNAVIMKKEQLAVLQPAIDRGDIKIVADQFIPDWKPELALNFAGNTLTQYSDNIKAFVVSNDGMAGGVVAALDKKGLAGKVIVTGQAGQFIPDWKPELALNFAENTLTQYSDNIKAFVVSNDGMAGGVVAALDKKGLAGRIVTGQHAEAHELAADSAEGTQSCCRRSGRSDQYRSG